MAPHGNLDNQGGPVSEVPDASPSTSVALLLSDTLEKEVTELEPLGNKIDTEALNRLFGSHPDTDVRLEFYHEGCRILIEEGDINVSKREQASG